MGKRNRGPGACFAAFVIAMGSPLAGANEPEDEKAFSDLLRGRGVDAARAFQKLSGPELGAPAAAGMDCSLATSRMLYLADPVEGAPYLAGQIACVGEGMEQVVATRLLTGRKLSGDEKAGVTAVAEATADTYARRSAGLQAVFLLERAKIAIVNGDLEMAAVHYDHVQPLAHTLDQVSKSIPVTDVIDAVGAADLLGRVEQMFRDETARSFWGNFSVGLVMNFKRDGDIKSASVTDGNGVTPGVVRVERADPKKVGLALEAHRYLGSYQFGARGRHYGSGEWLPGAVAWGLYASVMPGLDDHLVDVAGIGLMIGLLGDSHVDKRAAKVSMNLGAGLFADFNSLQLEESFVEGEPLPTGESAVRVKEETEYGLQAILSFTAVFR